MKKKMNSQNLQLGVVNNYAGMFVSLNMKKTNYFGVGEKAPKIWLSFTNWCDQIPEGLTDIETKHIWQALKEELIVEGKQWIPALDKDQGLLKEYISCLSDFTRADDEKFKAIVKDLFQKKTAGNYTSLEIFRAMLAKEKSGRNRPGFLTYLQDACDNCDQRKEQLVQDFPDDPHNFSIEIDPDTMNVVSTTKKVPIPDRERSLLDPLPEAKEKREFKGLDDPVERAKKIESIL